MKLCLHFRIQTWYCLADKKDGPLDIEEAEDVLAEIEELEKEEGEKQEGR